MSNVVPGSVVQAADKFMNTMAGSSGQEETSRAAKAAETVTVEAKESGQKMEAATWSGKKSITVAECSRPTVTDPRDVIVRMTSSAICGSDLHMFRGNIPGMKSGAIMGHEAMGVVEEVGEQVKTVKKGDRVVASFCLACGECFFCKKGLFSSCDMTNPSATAEKMMGQRSAGMLGYSTITGGFAGGQADYFRVPFGDVNCLVLPSENILPDDKALFLSDVLPTAWHGCELAGVCQDDVVAIWGAGPVGILSAHCAFARGARRVILVDNIPYRLEFAKRRIPQLETVDFSSGSAPERQVLALCKDEPGGGPDCVIECVGMHYTQSMLHKIEMAVGLETDSPEALNAAFIAVRKGGKVAGIGAYVGYANHFNIGALMEKCLTLASGQTPVQKYWNELLEKVRQGVLDPSIIVTHHMPLKEASKAYQIFDDKIDDVVKVVLHPSTVAMGK